MNAKMDMWYMYKLMFIVAVWCSPCTFGQKVWKIHIKSVFVKNRFVMVYLFKYIAYLSLLFEKNNAAN